MSKLYGIKRPDGTVVQERYAVAESKTGAAVGFVDDTSEGGEIGISSFIDDRGVLRGLRRRGYSVVPVKIVEDEG